MAFLYTSFVAIWTGTRDVTAEKGAVYHLDGNATNWRLNIAGGILKLWDDTQIFQENNPWHSFQRGQIHAKRLRFIANPKAWHRVDFWFSSCVWIVEDITFKYQWAWLVFNHLEDNTKSSVFTGSTTFLFDMEAWWSAFIQFNSVEMQNVVLNVAPTNQWSLNVYVARLSEKETSLTWFKTVGLTTEATIRIWNKTTSSGYLYSPTFVGATNNDITLKVGKDAWVRFEVNNKVKVFYVIDITAVHEDGKELSVWVKDSSWLVQHNQEMDKDDLTPKRDDWVVLEYYRNKKCVLVMTKSWKGNGAWWGNGIIQTVENSRTISYRIRRPDLIEISKLNSAFNNDDIIKEMFDDTAYDSKETKITTGITINATTKILTIGTGVRAQQLYNFVKEWLCLPANMETNNFISASWDVLDLDDYNIIINAHSSLSADVFKKIKTKWLITNNWSVSVTLQDKNWAAISLDVKWVPVWYKLVIWRDDDTTIQPNYDADLLLLSPVTNVDWAAWSSITLPDWTTLNTRNIWYSTVVTWTLNLYVQVIPSIANLKIHKIFGQAVTLKDTSIELNVVMENEVSIV